MRITLENKKIKALEYMEKLDIYKPYIKGFKNNNDICYFDYYAGFWAWQDEELMNKVKEIEEKHNCLVYAITHEYTEFGELYDFLLITDYEEEWDELLLNQVSKNQFYAFAYCYNKNEETFSEFGTIAIKSFGGGIARIG